MLYYLASVASEMPHGLVVTTIEEIASESGRSTRTIAKHLGTLITKGLVRIIIRDGQRMVVKVGPALRP